MDDGPTVTGARYAHVEHAARVRFRLRFRLGGDHPPPHAQYVDGETFRVGAHDRIVERIAGRVRPLTENQLTPSDAAEVGLSEGERE